MKCFFKKQRLNSTAKLAGFERLRAEDQKKIEAFISKIILNAVLGTRFLLLFSFAAWNNKTFKRKANKILMSAKALRDFGVQYSISSLATCRGCREIILKNEIRIKKNIYDTEVGIRCGGQALWHHLECFAKVNSFVTQLSNATYLVRLYYISAENRVGMVC